MVNKSTQMGCMLRSSEEQAGTMSKGSHKVSSAMQPRQFGDQEHFITSGWRSLSGTRTWSRQFHQDAT